MNKTQIKNWYPDDRPREKLRAKGPLQMTDSELLAILIQTGTKNLSAMELAKQLLERCSHHLLSHEVFAVLFLNRAHKIKHFEIISSGGMTGTIADPRIILKKALEEEAVSIILCHNHPSGNLKPSKADEEITFKIRNAAKFFDIQVLDHIIVSTEGYFSFADDGMM